MIIVGWSRSSQANKLFVGFDGVACACDDVLLASLLDSDDALLVALRNRTTTHDSAKSDSVTS
jgi:hypothetical protein